MSKSPWREERDQINAILIPLVKAEIERMPPAEREELAANARRAARKNTLRGGLLLTVVIIAAWWLYVATSNRDIFHVSEGVLTIGVVWLVVGFIMWARPRFAVTAVAKQRVLDKNPELAARVQAFKARTQTTRSKDAERMVKRILDSSG
jgi:hypothetical protein